MPAAARVTDPHVCPAATPTPHVGGVIMPPGVPTVFIGSLPAATAGSVCVCPGPPNSIAMGSTTVVVGSKPAARQGDPTSHGGKIALGCPTVLIGG